MSAKFDVQDKEWLSTSLKQGQITSFEETILITAFDAQTTYDIKQIEDQMTREKADRKACLYKIILFPLEYPLARVFLGKEEAEKRYTIFKIYKSYYFGKINNKEFKKKLANFFKDVKLYK